jgi:hypothetical protein
MTKAQTQPKFVPGSRVFTHYDMQWGTVTGINTTYRDQTHGVTGSKLPDTTWYDVQYDNGSTSLLDDAHGNWDMARIVPPHIAKRFNYGDDPMAEKREPFTIYVNGVDARSALVHSLIEHLGYGNHVGPQDPAGFADDLMVKLGKRSAWNDDGEYVDGYEEYARSAGLLRR